MICKKTAVTSVSSFHAFYPLSMGFGNLDLFFVSHTTKQLLVMNDIPSNFYRQRYYALLLGIIASVCVWYSIVLMTNPLNDMSVDYVQACGLGLSLFITVFIWLRNCLSGRPSRV